MQSTENKRLIYLFFKNISKYCKSVELTPKSKV